jgi:oligoribonuclease (3'-5' exoribonuclease)
MAGADVLVWLDMEMTGLEPDRERIIEMATILTDGNLVEIAIGPDLVIHQSDELLAAMDDWNKKHHGGSGLVERVKASTSTSRPRIGPCSPETRSIRIAGSCAATCLCSRSACTTGWSTCRP